MQYYKDKNFINVGITFRPCIKFDKLKENDWILAIQIYIYKVSDDGKIDYDTSNTWRLVINYTKNELDNNRFTLNELKNMIDKTAEHSITSDLEGISYTNWLKQIKKYTKRSKHK